MALAVLGYPWVDGDSRSEGPIDAVRARSAHTGSGQDFNLDDIQNTVRAFGYSSMALGGSWDKARQSLASGRPLIVSGRLGPTWKSYIHSTHNQSDERHILAVLGLQGDRFIVCDPFTHYGPVALGDEQVSVFSSRGNFTVTQVARS